MKSVGVKASSTLTLHNAREIQSDALYVALLLIPLFAFAPQAHAATPQCDQATTTAHGGYFTAYQSDAYSPQGLLIQHFKNDPTFPYTRPFTLSWWLFDDECNNAFTGFKPSVTGTIPAGVTDWSIRWASSTHFDVWDDDHHAIIASSTIDRYPPYTSISFHAGLDPEYITLTYLDARTDKIVQGGEPPLTTGTLDKDSACPSMYADTGFFDPTYEHAEYVDHLLRVHLRLERPSGGSIRLRALSINAACNDMSFQMFNTPWDWGTIPLYTKYYSFRMTTPTHWVLWNDEIDMQITCPGCEGDILPDTPYVSFYWLMGQLGVGGHILTTTPFHPTEQGCTENCNSNVLFLPGIEASRLYRPQVVGDLDKRLWEPDNDADALELTLEPDGTSVRDDVFTSDVLDEAFVPLAGPNIYKSFIDEMNTLTSEDKIEDWSAVPYDWRLSLDQILNNGTKTGNDISYFATSSDPYVLHELMRLASSSRTHKVTIIAHSNGGLVAKALMQKLGATTTAQLIDKVIFVASPQVGTPSAVAGLLHGYDQGIRFKVSDSAMRELGNNSPAAYNLLPSRDYFTYVDDPVATFDPATLPDWVSRYGGTIHSQERLHTFAASAFERVPVDSADTVKPVQLNDTLLTQAEDMHALLDNWSAPEGVRVIQIAGWGIPTTLKDIEYASTSKPVFCSGICAHGLGLTASTTIDGDGTVVVPSALWMSTTTGAVNYWVDLKQYNSFINRILGLRFKIKHADILEVSELLTFITQNLITNSTTTLPQYISTAIPPTDSHDIRLRFSLHSPLTLNLYDDFGRHTGVSTTTSQVEEQIPGTYYMEFGEVKYIFTDASTTAHIVMQGYDAGTFTFNVDEYQGDTRTASTTFQNIPTTASTTVSLDIQSDISTLSPMRIDKDGNGAIDATITPVPDGIAIFDTTPPEITITFATSTNSIVYIGTDPSNASGQATGTVTISSTTTYPVLKKKEKEPHGVSTTTVTARDEAGNTTALVYTERLPSPKQRDTITLKEIAYNGATTTIASTTISYKWRQNKDGSYKLFASHLATFATSTESHYRPKKDITVIMTKPRDLDEADNDDDADVRPTKETLPGMVVPYMRTEEGKMIIRY